MYTILCLLSGLLVGFASGADNDNRSVLHAVWIGVVYSVLLFVLFVLAGARFSSGYASGVVFCLAVFAGSFAAAFTPNTNPIKRYFDLRPRG